MEAEERLKTAQARLGNLKVPKRPPEIEALRAQLNQARAARSSRRFTRASEKHKGSFIARPGSTKRATYEREVARVREAEAQLKNALQPLGRDAEREAAEGEVEAAKAALAQAAWRLDQKSVATPVAGLVHETFFVEGEWVAARAARRGGAAAGKRQGPLVRAGDFAERTISVSPTSSPGRCERLPGAGYRKR